MKAKKIPIIVRRYLPDGSYEDWYDIFNISPVYNYKPLKNVFRSCDELILEGEGTLLTDDIHETCFA